MSKEKTLNEYYINKGTKLQCIICKNTKFWTRKSLLNTKGLTFFNLDWANKSATNYICGNCGYVHWFVEQ